MEDAREQDNAGEGAEDNGVVIIGRMVGRGI